ncbi:MAG: hypothetical protein JXQ83_07240 [Candidatus Glassbacteria bacterium]|nr:hypothetical protein [Candidatus Glassbacteria bacterium]
MLKLKDLLSKAALAALVFGLASPAAAIQTKSRKSQGNNFGFEMNLGSTVFAGTSEYPRGSGNEIPTYEGGWGHFLAVSRDLDGDGASEDTLYGHSRGRTIGGKLGSLEAYDILKQGYDAGERMDQWASRVEVNEVYSSLDPDNLARWPAEFREGRTLEGEPVLHGVETLCARHSDVFDDSYHQSKPPTGVSMEYQFFFLNFGESNDIGYGHLFIRNMSEYLVWNPNPDYVGQVSATPNGQDWGGFCLVYVENYIGIGPEAINMDEGWAFHPEKEIKCMVDYDGMEPTFTRGGHTFILGYKSLRPCSWQDETMALTNCNNMRWGTEFGFTISRDIGTEANPGLVYRWCKAVHDGVEEDMSELFEDELSPWTGRPAVGVPGMLLPTDGRYSQWLWGRQGRINYTAWSELHDFGPRDSTSTDFAIMCCYPANPPMVLKPSAVEYIDDPELQVQMEPMEVMGDVVKAVYEGGYTLAETPLPQPLTIIPGDGKVTITWSDVNLNTPDAFYYFLQEHPEADPNQVYREYDFEGYRLYRNYTGPSDAHAELIDSCSLSDNNLHFHYVDTRDKDLSYRRLRNGLKVWYALVPYDRNYNPQTGEEFSLPAEGTSKVWNRPFPEGYHTVRPRSDASNFKPASMSGVAYVPESVSLEAVSLTSFKLSGDGTGRLTEPPQFLEPQVEIMLETVIDEKIKEDLTVFLDCYEMGFEVKDPACGSGYSGAGKRFIRLLDSSGEVLDEPAPVPGRNYDEEAGRVFNGPLERDGLIYVLRATFKSLAGGELYYHIDPGAYDGADVYAVEGKCSNLVGTAPGNEGFARTGVFELTWKDAGDGNLTLEVQDKTRGLPVPFSPYTDNGGWGFLTSSSMYMRAYTEIRDEVPRELRERLMVETMPAENDRRFGVYVNGLVWEIYRSGGFTMPSPGTVFTVANAFGTWNEDSTRFTQYPDPPFPGDRWRIEIKSSTLNEEDIELSKIRVVPNPYIATSVLDQSGGSRRIDFVNLPDRCTIRIYTLSGNLINVLNHIGASRTGWGNFVDVDNLQPNNEPFSFTGYDNHGGTEAWNMKNRFGQTVASGLYFYHVTDPRGKTHTGKFYIVN